jgi:hypothetical protein
VLCFIESLYTNVEACLQLRRARTARRI